MRQRSGRVIEGLVLGNANREHAIVSGTTGRADASLVQRFQVGSRLRVVPNHACAVAASSTTTRC